MEDLNVIRLKLKKIWQNSGLSFEKFARDMDMVTMSLRRFVILEKPVSYKNLFKIINYIEKNKSPE